MLKVKVTKLADAIWPHILADIPVMIVGPTGVGKSTIIRNEVVPRIGREFGVETVFHDYRLSTKDVVDGTGMPFINKEEMATYWTRPAFIPRDDGKFHVIFYDEFGHASVQLQQMSYSAVRGFQYKTCAFDWMKAHAGQIDMFRDDGDPLMGMDYWTRANSEPCLLATRGKPKRLNADVRQGIIAPRREHRGPRSWMIPAAASLTASMSA